MTPQRTIKICYSCDGCGMVDQPVQVPERLPDEDIVHWMREVLTQKVAQDHFNRTNHLGGCPSRLLTNLKIPIFEDTALGRNKDA